MGRPRASPMYLAACRNRLLGFIASGTTQAQAAAECGVAYTSLRRYAVEHPEFDSKILAAQIGEQWDPEPEPGSAHPAPPDVLDVDVVGAIRKAMPWQPPEGPRPPPPERLEIPGLDEAAFFEVVKDVALDPEHPAWGKIAPILIRLYRGADMLRAERAAETANPDGRQRVLVIRVPSGRARGAAK